MAIKSRPAFPAWMKLVDAEISRRTGLTSDDLPDFLYDNEYEDEATPRQAATAAVRAANE